MRATRSSEASTPKTGMVDSAMTAASKQFHRPMKKRRQPARPNRTASSTTKNASTKLCTNSELPLMPVDDQARHQHHGVEHDDACHHLIEPAVPLRRHHSGCHGRALRCCFLCELSQRSGGNNHLAA